MAKVLNYEQLTEYLRTCFEIEKTIYIQQSTLLNMNKQYHQLGRERKRSMPEKSYCYFSMGKLDGVGISIFIVLLAINFVTLIPLSSTNLLKAIDNLLDASGQILFRSILITAFIPVYCAIKGYIEYKNDLNKANTEYKIALREYDKSVQKDKERIETELLQKKLLAIQISQLKEKMEASKETRAKIYACNVLEENYRGLIPTAYIYQYLKVGKTLCLKFNPSTGDTGAYNLYDNDRRLDRIISQNDIIINKLDKLYDVVLSLKSDIMNMNIKINSLSSNFKQFSSQALKSINQIEAHSAVTEYNSECTRREIEFSTTMHAIGLWR